MSVPQSISGQPVPETPSRLAQVPRPITPKAQWRLWAEPGVRFWWLSSVILLLISVAILVAQIMATVHTRWRIDRWTRVNSATIAKIDITVRPSYHVAADELATKTVTIEYVDAAGKKQELTGKLEGRSWHDVEAREALKSETTFVHPQMKIPILVNPENPAEWSDVVDPRPLLLELMVPLLLLLAPLVFGAVAFWQRGRWMNLWRTGAAMQAVVAKAEQSAIAPRSMIYRCTLRGSADKRLVSVAIPRAAVKLAAGDTVWVIVPRSEPTRAIAAMLYE